MNWFEPQNFFLEISIDELKFYNYAKTAAETAEAYLAAFEDWTVRAQ